MRALIDRGLQVIAPRVRAGQLDWAVVELNSESAIGSFGIREVIGPSVGIDAEPLQRATLIFYRLLPSIDAGCALAKAEGFTTGSSRCSRPQPPAVRPALQSIIKMNYSSNYQVRPTIAKLTR